MTSFRTKSFSIIATALCTLACVSAPTIALAQAAQSPDQGIPASSLATKSATAVGYEVGSGSTKVSLIGTELAPGATGQAKVEIKSKADSARIQIDVKGLKPAYTMGAEFLTYVAWAVTPEGRSGNLGELLLDKNGNGSLNATTPSQAFSLIVTAEPYFAVHLPSEMVAMQSEPGKKTEGKIFPVSQYKLMRRAQYERMGNPLALAPDPKVPLALYEARNAVEVAKSRKADKYAPEIFSKAAGGLQQAEAYFASKSDKNTIVAASRQTVQFAEDARALSVQRQEDERIVNEREAAAAKAKAAAEAQAATEAAEARKRSDAAAAEARAKADADAAAAKAQADAAAAQASREAAAAKQKADAEIAAQADARRKAELEQQQLRARLLAQFNRVLPTTDTDRGLVVNMGDVLFATGKADLGPDAKIALAKLSGIVLNYPSLKLAIGGYTDSTGGAELNQTLSTKRAGTVMDYLVTQGLDVSTLSAQGYGMSNPVADNTTAAGRQKNRRVEIVISGAVIGAQLKSAPPAPAN
jgi:outer membrane protein OmpA-like peptidoglycan-associated protein